MRHRRRYLALGLPALIVVGADALRRGERFAAFDGAHAIGYAATALSAGAAWAALLYTAASPSRWRAGAWPFVACFGLSGAVQADFFARYDVYLGLDAQINAASIVLALSGSLPWLQLLPFMAGWLLIAVGCVWAAARWLEPPRLTPRARAAASLLPLALFASVPTSYRGVQSSTPDMLYFHALRVAVVENGREALGGMPRAARVELRSPRYVPPLDAAPSTPRNVLVILQEAVRADVVCLDPDEPCAAATPASHRAAPRRIPFFRMRSVSSSTAIALATLWTGLPPTAPRDVLFSAPLLWEYAARAGYHTAYWTSQHPMFANTRLTLEGVPLDICVWATHIDPLADDLIGPPDEAVSARALADLDALGEPFFAVVHYSNVHMPRRVDPARAPFQPSDDHFRRVAEPAALNYYKNAVYLSDLAVGALLDGLRAHPAGARTVVVYLSDHGEAWLEHEQSNDHGQTLYDEEIRIPAWIEAPPGALSAEEERALRAARQRDLFQTDIAPTLLDLLGLWELPALAELRAPMPGSPLTRTPTPRPFEVLTNVSWAWEYEDPNWALMRPPYKLLATAWDDAYRCYDTTADPREEHDLGAAACGDLAARADEVFGMLPKGLGRLRTHPDWGWPRDE